jgi:hypothetical protein
MADAKATLKQRAATRALAAEFGPALVWSHVHDEQGTCLLWTDTTPTLALLVSADGAISSPLGGEPERWTREADGFDRQRVSRAVRQMVQATDHAATFTYI